MAPPKKARKKRRYKRSKRSSVDRRQNRKISKLFRLVKKESKYIDQYRETTASQSWNNILTRDLTYIAQGTDVNQRIGSKIMIKNIKCNIVVTIGDTLNLYRIMLVRWGPSDPAQIAVQNVLETPTGPQPQNLLSHYKRDPETNYQVLWDSGVQRLVGNGSANAPLTPITNRIHNINVTSKRGFYTQYSASSANTCNSGYIYLIAASDSAIAPNVGFQTDSRVIFTG